MPANSIVHLCALPSEFGETMAEMRLSYAKRGINLSWISPVGEVDYRPSYRKAISAADGVLFMLGRQHGPEVPTDEESPLPPGAVGQSYLEYATELALERAIPIGVLVMHPDFAGGEVMVESTAKVARQKEFRKRARKMRGLIKSVTNSEELNAANSQFREFLKGGPSEFPYGWVIGTITAGLAVFGIHSLWHSYHPHNNDEVEYNVQSASKAAFDGAQAPQAETVRDAAPLPPELASQVGAPNSRTALAQIAPDVVERYRDQLEKIKRLQLSGQIGYAKKALISLMPELQKALGKMHPVTLQAQLTAGEISSAEGFPAIAIQIYEQTYNTAKENYGETDDATLNALNHQGNTLLQSGDFEKAALVFSRLLKSLAKLPATEHKTERGVARFSLARAYMQLNRSQEAIPLLEEAEKESVAELGKYHQTTQLIQKMISQCSGEK